MNYESRRIFAKDTGESIQSHVDNQILEVMGSFGDGDHHKLVYHVGSRLYSVVVHGETVGAHPDAEVALQLFLNS